MGGAIAVHAAVQDLVPSLSGLIVIDVVEGTALEALSSMQSFLRGRPKVFKSLEHAIEWWYVDMSIEHKQVNAFSDSLSRRLAV